MNLGYKLIMVLFFFSASMLIADPQVCRLHIMTSFFTRNQRYVRSFFSFFLLNLFKYDILLFNKYRVCVVWCIDIKTISDTLFSYIANLNHFNRTLNYLFWHNKLILPTHLAYVLFYFIYRPMRLGYMALFVWGAVFTTKQ